MMPPEDESNPVYDIVYAFKLLLRKPESDPLDSITYARSVLSKVRSILSSDATAEVFAYLCLHGSATAWVLQCRLGMTEPTAYRALKHLRSLEIIVPALKITKKRRSRGGPRPTMWAIEGASPEEVAEADPETFGDEYFWVYICDEYQDGWIPVRKEASK